jgi:hypothetical protein
MPSPSYARPCVSSFSVSLPTLQVEENGTWSLFCPNEAPGLADSVGDAFTALYEGYEAKVRGQGSA